MPRDSTFTYWSFCSSLLNNCKDNNRFIWPSHLSQYFFGNEWVIVIFVEWFYFLPRAKTFFPAQNSIKYWFVHLSPQWYDGSCSNFLCLLVTDSRPDFLLYLLELTEECSIRLKCRSHKPNKASTQRNYRAQFWKVSPSGVDDFELMGWIPYFFPVHRQTIFLKKESGIWKVVTAFFGACFFFLKNSVLLRSQAYTSPYITRSIWGTNLY